VMALAKKHSLYVIEDCAEAIGTRYRGRPVGTIGDVGCFSFFGNKTITTGEGGMVVSNNHEIADKVMHLKGQGVCREREYWHDAIGFNYRMTNLCAAIGCAQMESIDDLIARVQGGSGRRAGAHAPDKSGYVPQFLDGLHPCRGSQRTRCTSRRAGACQY